MSDLWQRATDKQIGVAFGRSIGQAQDFGKTLDRSDPADSLVLAGFGILLNLMHHQLEYTLDRKKRDPEAMLAEFREDIDGFKAQLETKMVKQEQVDETLAQIGIDEQVEPETQTIPGTLALCIRLRWLQIKATYNDKKRLITYPTSERARVEKQAKHWPREGGYPGEVRDMGRSLCGLPEDSHV